MANPAPKIKCTFCHRVAHEVKRANVGGKVWITLDCHHTLIRDALKVESFEEMVSRDGRTPFPFQVATAEFGERANLSYICAHEMGLGKTVIDCLLSKRNHKRITPNLKIVKSGLRMQWWAEHFRWTGEMAQIIESSNDKPDFDMFDTFIISFDTLRLVRPVISDEENEINKAVQEMSIQEQSMRGLTSRKAKTIKWDDSICRFKSITIDETQQIKNPSSARTKSLNSIVEACIRNNGGQPIMIAGYSGTPIKNRPSEYETLLRLVRPEQWWNGRLKNMIKYSQVTGKEIGLRNPAEFEKLTKDYVIRFERSEVKQEILEKTGTALPGINRMFQLADMKGSNFLDVYKRTVKEFQEWMDIQEKSPSSADLLGWFSRMRHITGMAKVNQGIDFVEEFLLSNNRKLVIFLHHKEVAKAMMLKLDKMMREGAWEGPLQLSADLDMRQRNEVIEDFKKPEYRVMIASQLAAGEGLNLQFCSDALMMERQWNPANEEQCEARFPRPGSTAEIVNVWYLIADGTIDEFLTELVEQKRAVFQQVMDGKEVNWQEFDLIKELTEVIRKKGMRKFMDSR